MLRADGESLSELAFLTGKARCNQVKFRCDCNPDSESGLLGELNPDSESGEKRSLVIEECPSRHAGPNELADCGLNNQSRHGGTQFSMLNESPIPYRDTTSHENDAFVHLQRVTRLFSG